MRVLIIGATAHVGTYLVPALVRAGHGVVAMSRGTRSRTIPTRRGHRSSGGRRPRCRGGRRRFRRDGARHAARRLDRHDPLRAGVAATAARRARARPALLMRHRSRSAARLSSRRPESRTRALPTASTGQRGRDRATGPSADLGCVALHPGHISGPGRPVINPSTTWIRPCGAVGRGEPVAVPGDGVAAAHHVYAQDVAQAFELALTSEAATGRAFHVVSEQAMSARGLADAAANWSVARWICGRCRGRSSRPDQPGARSGES